MIDLWGDRKTREVDAFSRLIYILFTNHHPSVRHLVEVGILVDGLDEFAGGAEDLHLVVFGRGKHEPGVVLVPVEVADAVCEAAVHEETGILLVRVRKNKQHIVLTVLGGRPPSHLASALPHPCSDPRYRCGDRSWSCRGWHCLADATGGS